MKMSDGMKYAMCGALAGIANGFFGAGGGMVLVPLFTRWIKMEDKTAFATSLAVILPLSVVSVIIYLIKGSAAGKQDVPDFRSLLDICDAARKIRIRLYDARPTEQPPACAVPAVHETPV